MIPNYEAFKNYLMHYGMPRRSGRYPWGSGKDPYQHSGDFLSRVDELKKQGMSEKEIADAFGLSTTQFRTQVSLAKDERRAVLVETAKDLRAKGYSLNEIAEKMGYDNDSSVRSLLNETSEARMNQAKVAAEYLKQLAAAPDWDAAAKTAKTRAFAENLLNQGGPAVDQVTRLFGRETAERLILRHMYGVEE